jgi:hypothetical protein
MDADGRESNGENNIDLTDNDAFDKYACQYGWEYDNGGRYRDEYWEWFVGRSPSIVLLRQPPDRLALVRFDGLTPNELWLGRASTSQQFDQVMRDFMGLEKS